jgi:DNA-binding response OmpR family regulator
VFDLLPGSFPHLHRSKMIILFVDDDPDDYDIFRDALKAAKPKTKCLHVEDGQAAIDFLNDGISTLPDYIFLDINMPIMGGKECLMRIKKNPKLKMIPVIMYSTTSSVIEINEFKKLGAKDFIVKPATFRNLVNTLKEVI